ncbi:MAG: lysine biosynthesis protein LysW [Parcubacteria group bacterium]|nr:lysine biosynthesis protein LysW [Parcubacteria group bacterium]
MKTTSCPVCSSDVIIEEGLAEKDLVGCLNCGAELEIITWQPLQLNPLEEESDEENDG